MAKFQVGEVCEVLCNREELGSGWLQATVVKVVGVGGLRNLMQYHVDIHGVDPPLGYLYWRPYEDRMRKIPPSPDWNEIALRNDIYHPVEELI